MGSFVGTLPRLFIILTIYSVGLYLFMTGLLPTDRLFSGVETAPDKIAFSSPLVSRFVLMVVDGLRSDQLFGPKYSSYWPKVNHRAKIFSSSCSISFIQPPTVTMPRIKAITSGRVPKFADVIQNLNAQEMREDNWISRLRAQNWKLEFYGDETWLKLFPNSFTRFDGTSSFFVNDYFEVDHNVTRHLEHLQKRSDEWNGLILHYLGLDHIGHVEGPHGRSVRGKLVEMDNVAGRVIDLLSNLRNDIGDDWLFILIGDHGVSDQGGHGGSSHEEISTGLLLLSSIPKRVTYNTESCQLLFPNLSHTQQVDLATLLGLVTGTGIPTHSLGILALDWLNTFWLDVSSRFDVLLRSIRHATQLWGCKILSSVGSNNYSVNQVYDCPSRLIGPNEVLLFNSFLKKLALDLSYTMQPNTMPVTNVEEKVAQLNGLAAVLHKLLTKVQQRALTGEHHLDMKRMLFGGLLMWCITAVVGLDMLHQLTRHQRTPFHKLTWSETRYVTKSELLSPASLRLLCAFCVICLLIQTFSLAGNSYAEEEHQLWYHFSTSALILSTVLLFLSDHSNTLKRSASLPLLTVLLLDRLLLRQMHQTGDRWIYLPDLSDWLYSPEHVIWLWPIQLISWGALFCLRWIAIEKHGHLCNLFGRGKLLQYSPLVSVLAIAVGQLYYRWVVDSGHKYASIVSARIVFLLLLIDCVVCFLWHRTYEPLQHVLLSSEYPQLLWTSVIHPFNTFPLLVCILGRTSVSILWIGITIKETALACYLQHFRTQYKPTAVKLFGLQLTCCWLIYWIQGWASFFQQGNSLSLATVDVSAAYVGLQTYQPIVCGLLLIAYTYAGPLYWQFAYVARYSTFKVTDVPLPSVACFRFGFAIFPVTFCATVCFLLRSHLFIWTVFTPKLLYLVIFYVTFIPIFLFCSARHL